MWGELKIKNIISDAHAYDDDPEHALNIYFRDVFSFGYLWGNFLNFLNIIVEILKEFRFKKNSIILEVIRKFKEINEKLEGSNP